MLWKVPECSIITKPIAKLSPSSISSWLSLALLSLLNHPPTHPATHPVKVSKQLYTGTGKLTIKDDLKFI
jgi:hypothetical protein